MPTGTELGNRIFLLYLFLSLEKIQIPRRKNSTSILFEIYQAAAINKNQYNMKSIFCRLKDSVMKIAGQLNFFWMMCWKLVTPFVFLVRIIKNNVNILLRPSIFSVSHNLWSEQLLSSTLWRILFPKLGDDHWVVDNSFYLDVGDNIPCMLSSVACIV